MVARRKSIQTGPVSPQSSEVFPQTEIAPLAIENASVVGIDRRITFASMLIYFDCVHDVDPTSGIRNQTGFLQVLRDSGYASAPDTHHLSQKLLREW